jgi:hypothetical protein
MSAFKHAAVGLETPWPGSCQVGGERVHVGQRQQPAGHIRYPVVFDLGACDKAVGFAREWLRYQVLG